MANRNRSAGNAYERKVVAELKSLGFHDAVTSRAESRNMDARKVDVFGPSLPVHVQCKVQKDTFNYHNFFTDKDLARDKPVVVMHKKVQKSKGGKFMGKGEYVIMDKNLFYKILKALQ